MRLPCAGSKGEELVEGLFVLAHAPHSRLLLLGIANSIDLVQQLMRTGGVLQVCGGWRVCLGCLGCPLTCSGVLCCYA